MGRLENLFDKYAFPARTSYPGRAIEDIEQEIGFQLPEDYKLFLRRYSGFEGMINCEYVVLWEIEAILELNAGYEIISSLPNTIGIGGSGGGDMIAIEFEEPDNYKIILAPFIGLDEKEYHIEIGNSFYDMLARLDAGKGWF
ncbi:SMI1/KNR4 family protein [Mucilaginibacter paludis]|uniref:Cell wall assembly/cell proliferation coordinating protein, KNR4-like protein n=1 Tax=Mucilaginibacter paludis DSM 18603 TaxID=714943 RepID=H1Y8X8_9SPHI|nr:SMI1/KNR4 family protein [Mucilaginibacter paludis]EHQ28744.1 Cell wall assembly/cell proliferation coordinating protein, KNR4-like protein [Mucilaginibacter paludis DSM 18603]